MSVKIRLMRAGAKHRPFYRVVVTDSRSPRDGRFIEVLGYYDPLPEAELLKIDEEKARTWMSRGAVPSTTAARDAAARAVPPARGSFGSPRH